jgi:prepilin-type N-terminal cleavage/methylation domain-containing protein
VVAARPGFSLTEIIVAMTLLSVAALGIAATALVAVQSFTRAEMQQIVLREAETVLDSLLALPRNASGSRAVHTSLLLWNAADSVGAITLTVKTPYRGSIQLIGQR